MVRTARNPVASSLQQHPKFARLGPSYWVDLVITPEVRSIGRNFRGHWWNVGPVEEGPNEIRYRATVA